MLVHSCPAEPDREGCEGEDAAVSEDEAAAAAAAVAVKAGWFVGAEGEGVDSLLSTTGATCC